MKPQENSPHLPPFCAIVLAAGKGTRMRSALPKVLHPLAGFPLLWHVLQNARTLGAQQTVVVVGPDMQAVADSATSALPGCRTVVQTEQLGTGHAVRYAEEALTDGTQAAHVVLYGDTPLIRPDTIARLLARLAHADLAVLGMRPADPKEYGRLMLNDAGQLEAIVEFKDATPEQRAVTLCNSGVMAVGGGRLFELLKEVKNENSKGEYYLTDLVGIARARGLICAVEEAPEEELLGVNSREELAVAEAIFQGRMRRRAMQEGATLIDPASVYFAADTRIGRDVVIEPNVMFGPESVVEDGVQIRAFSHIAGARIGANATIGPFARLRPGAVLKPKVHVGNFVEIKKATLQEGAKVNHLSYIGDATVGSGANIGAGTITCNYDGFHKYETVIGKNAFIGSNTALVAPVTVGDGAIIGAGSTITQDVEADAIATNRAPFYQKPEGARQFRERRRKN